MKTIHLIRHAKSSWGSQSLADVNRPLNTRGEQSCELMARPILQAGCSFRHVFCSIARRAQMTIEGISHSLPEIELAWKLDEALYTFSSQDVFDWCLEIDDALDEVVIVGHNPAFTGLINSLGDQYIENLPTCGYAQLTFPQNSWSEITSGSGKTMSLLRPKMFD